METGLNWSVPFTVLATLQILSMQLVAPRVGRQRMIIQKCRRVLFACELVLLRKEFIRYLLSFEKVIVYAWLNLIGSFLKINCFNSEN